MAGLHLQCTPSLLVLTRRAGSAQLRARRQRSSSAPWYVQRASRESVSHKDSSHPKLLKSRESLQAHCIHGCLWCFSSGDLLKELEEEVEVTRALKQRSEMPQCHARRPCCCSSSRRSAILRTCWCGSHKSTPRPSSSKPSPPTPRRMKRVRLRSCVRLTTLGPAVQSLCDVLGTHITSPEPRHPTSGCDICLQVPKPATHRVGVYDSRKESRLLAQPW